MAGSGTRDQWVPSRRSTAVKDVPVQTDQASLADRAVSVPDTPWLYGPIAATTRQPGVAGREPFGAPVRVAATRAAVARVKAAGADADDVEDRRAGHEQGDDELEQEVGHAEQLEDGETGAADQ